MKNRNLLQLFFVYAFIVMVFSSCKKDDVEPEDENIEYHKLGGFYIANEGIQNGSISFYDSVKDIVVNNVFQNANSNRALGKYVQSITVVGDKAVICVNGGNNVVITEAANMKQVAEITIPSPRYTLEIDENTVLVSSWSDKIFVLDIEKGKILKEIAVGKSPERMIKVGDKVFVANSGNNFGAGGDKLISIIDAKTLEVTKSLNLEYFSPVAFAKESDNYIWALCQGKTEYNSSFQIVGQDPSCLVKIDVAACEVVKMVKLYEEKHPANIAITNDKKDIIIGGGFGFVGLYKMPLSSDKISDNPFITEACYGFSVNPATGNIIGLVPALNGETTMIRYQPDGNEINRYQVGVYGNGAAFKKRSN